MQSYRDPATRHVKQTWKYLGRLEAPPSEPDCSGGGSRRRIIDAILNLLDKRDLSHITVSVITCAACVSRATFYRYFKSKASALEAAFEQAFGEMRRAPRHRLLDEPVGSAESERERLGEWIATILRSSVRSPGVQRSSVLGERMQRARVRHSDENHAAVHETLTRYLARLRRAGIITAASDDVLADGIQCVISGIFKRVVYDRKLSSEAALISAGVELICRALFGTAAKSGQSRSRLL